MFPTFQRNLRKECITEKKTVDNRNNFKEEYLDRDQPVPPPKGNAIGSDGLRFESAA